MATTYDPACVVLAEHFLYEDASCADHLRRVESLALAIQQAVEDWLEDEERRQQVVGNVEVKPFGNCKKCRIVDGVWQLCRKHRAITRVRLLAVSDDS